MLNSKRNRIEVFQAKTPGCAKAASTLLKTTGPMNAVVNAAKFPQC